MDTVDPRERRQLNNEIDHCVREWDEDPTPTTESALRAVLAKTDRWAEGKRKLGVYFVSEDVTLENRPRIEREKITIASQRRESATREPLAIKNAQAIQRETEHRRGY
jgi:hypothetical protein